MYSMVMMMAVASGGDTASFGKRNGCDGGSCHGVVVSSCYGCMGGSSCNGGSGCSGSSCHGGRGFLGGRDKHGCSGGGFLGMRGKKHGCSGSSCHGCNGGSSCHGCNGGMSCHGGSSCHGGGMSCHGGNGCHGAVVHHGAMASHDPCALPATGAPIMMPPAGSAAPGTMTKPADAPKTDVKPDAKKDN